MQPEEARLRPVTRLPKTFTGSGGVHTLPGHFLTHDLGGADDCSFRSGSAFEFFRFLGIALISALNLARTCEQESIENPGIFAKESVLFQPRDVLAALCS
jgi:hypothetical protein